MLVKSEVVECVRVTIATENVKGDVLLTPGTGCMVGTVFVHTGYGDDGSLDRVTARGADVFLSGTVGRRSTGAWTPGAWTNADGQTYVLPFNVRYADRPGEVPNGARGLIIGAISDAVATTVAMLPDFFAAAERATKLAVLDAKIETARDTVEAAEGVLRAARRELNDLQTERLIFAGPS
jgi:hypothetical protein